MSPQRGPARPHPKGFVCATEGPKGPMEDGPLHRNDKAKVSRSLTTGLGSSVLFQLKLSSSCAGAMMGLCSCGIEHLWRGAGKPCPATCPPWHSAVSTVYKVGAWVRLVRGPHLAKPSRFPPGCTSVPSVSAIPKLTLLPAPRCFIISLHHSWSPESPFTVATHLAA